MAKKNGKFVELVEGKIQLEEAPDGSRRRIRIEGAITANVVNGNKRRYPADVLETAVAELRGHLNESAGQGRAVQVLGEAEHPSEKGGRPNLLETVVKWEDVAFDGSRVDVTGRILETSKGKDILSLMEGGVLPGVSLRGYGDGKKEKGIFEVKELHITGFDLVLEPSFENAAQLIESKHQNEGETEMTLEELKQLLADQPDLFGKKITEADLEKMGEAQLKKVEEAIRTKLNIGADADIAKALEVLSSKAGKYDESQRKAEVDSAIEEACKELPFGEKLNKQFSEALREAGLPDAASVTKFAEAKRKEYGKIAAELKLGKQGFNGKGGVQVLGEVLEQETGTPEFARGAFEIGESIRRTELRSARDLRKAETPAEIYTAQLLKRFDTLYQHHLLAESRMLQEASVTSDMNLPYSVARGLIEEAFPNLVAAGIFDVGTIETSPTRLYFDRFTGETGYAANLTAATFVAAEDAWVSVGQGRITPDTVVITNNAANVTYEEGTDYIVDYAGGRVKVLGDTLDGDTLKITAAYTAIRKGEMAPIERAKVIQDFMVIEAAADRLATQISKENIVFTRSQMGSDIVARTLSSLVRQVRGKIDQGLLYWAYSAVKGVSNNATAAWTVDNSQQSLSTLVELMGQAKVKVANRYYSPTFFLMSTTNADLLSNWEGYKTDGFPNAILNAAGFAGRIKGLPIFASTEFPDSLIIAGNRELVMHRVFQPMIIEGPEPTIDVSTGKIIAAKQYYAEEFNVTESPVYEKGAFVPVVEDEGS